MGGSLARSARGCNRDRRFRSVSQAIKSNFAALLLASISLAKARLLPPAPAQRSMTFMPDWAWQIELAHWEPASCISIAPAFHSGD